VADRLAGGRADGRESLSSSGCLAKMIKVRSLTKIETHQAKEQRKKP